MSASALRPIDPAPFVSLAGELPDLDCGEQPKLRWIEIEKLFVDPGYQRDLGGSGKKNILRITREFDWAKFATVIVAPIADGRFAIVDGQHRTTAAALRDLKKVPCQIITADRRRQAAAFAAINANITEMSPMQLHAAKLAAGDVQALRLQKLCAAVGVNVLRYPVHSKNHKAGDTMAPGALYRSLAKFGEDVLSAALCCITQTRDGYPGFLRSPLITALCTVLETNPDWNARKKLLPAIEKLDLIEVFQKAWQSARAGSGGGLVKALAGLISSHLAREMGERAPLKPNAAAPSPALASAGSGHAAAHEGVEHNGVTVDVAAGVIRFRRKSISVKSRHALLVALLARGMPAPIALRFLLQRVCARESAADASDVLDHMARECNSAVSPLGLQIKIVKGIGIALGIAE